MDVITLEPQRSGSSGRRVLVGLVTGVVLAGSFVVAPLSGSGVGAQGAPACTITGTFRGEVLRGTAGDDVICGLGGDDRLVGGGGDDVLFGGDGRDVLLGGSGHDLLRGGPHRDVLHGGSGDDSVRGGAGGDTVQGGSGADWLRGSQGGDRLSGGPGRDVVAYMPRSAPLRLSIGDGANDGARGEGDNIAADVEDLRGGAGNDVLIGSGGRNRLFGLSGNDRVVGGGGNDVISGGAGTDVIDGRDGASFVDQLKCGAGAGDRALADMADQVQGGCEVVVQNDRPTAVTLAPATVEENEPVGTLVGALSATDPDPADVHTFTLVTGAGSTNNGSFTIAGTQLRTRAVFDFETKGSYTIRVRATDTEGSTFDQPLTITVVDTDEPPVAVDDTATVAEDAAATTVDVLANDTDVDGGPMSIISVVQPANGTATNGGTDVSYQPDADFCGADSFTYTLNGGSIGTVTVTVSCVDDLPVAVNDTATVAEDDPATTLDVLANDVDADDDPFTIDTVTQPANGTVVITNGGDDLTYQPDPDFCGTDSFTYTLDPGGSTATVSVTVTCVDDAPVAVDDTATVVEDDPATPIDVLGNDTDVDNGPISITSVTQPADGTVVITSGGDDLTFQPDPDFCGADSFTYTLNGGSTATVDVTVTCVDDDPVAVDDTATVTEDDPATTVDVLGNDTDVDGGPMVIDSVTQPVNGTVVITNGGDDLTYQPDPNYCNSQTGGTPDTFTYTLDPGGSIATVEVTVTCVVEDPVAVNDTATVNEDSAASTIDVLANDVDADSVGITVDTVTQPANGTVVITNGGDDLTYQPDADFCGADPFTYTIDPGGSTATVSVTVTCVDDDPVAVDDTATVAEDAAATPIDVLANDTDVDGGPETIASVTQPTNGNVVITGGGSGLTYQPNSNYCGADSFTYTLTPGGSTATVSVTVTCVNDAPVAVNDTATVLEDAGATPVDVLANDTDVEGDPITIASVVQPGNGTVVITGGGTGLTYQPNPNYCNNPPGTTPDTFTYTITGGDDATVSVTVTCVDDPPVAVNDTATVLEDAAATAVNVLANDTDVDGGPKVITAITQPTNGSVVTTGGGTGLTYQPNPNYCNNPPGTTPDTFTYTITGGDDATVSVTVTCVDDPPVAVNDTATVLEDAVATAVNVLANDTDIDAGPTTVNAVTQPANGSVVITGGGTGLTYQPNPNYCNDPPGTTPDTFTYTLNGGSTATVSMTVTCVNDPPVADNETFNGANTAVGNTTFIVNDPDDGAPTVVGPNKTVTGDLLDGDSDIDGPGPLVIVAGTTATADGGSVTIQADGDFTYTPVAGTSCTDTTDSFSYIVSDQNPGTPGTATGTVTITISGCVWYVRADAPAAGDGRSQTPFNTLTAADTAATGTGQTIYVFRAAGDTGTVSDASLDLLANQTLLGSAVNLVVDTATLYTGNDTLRPSLTSTSVKLDDGNTVRGLSISGTGSGAEAIEGGTGDVAGTLDNLIVSGTTGGIELNTTSGTFNVSALTVTTTGGTGVALTNAGTVNFAGTITVTTSGGTGVALTNAGTINFASAGTITITTSGGKALDATGATTNFGTGSVIDDLTVTGSSTGAINLAATTGTLNLGDGSGTDLNLTTTSGATAALASTHTGTLTVNPTGTDNVSATGGPAIDITGAASLAFDDVDSTNSAGDGINLANFGGGTFSAPSGTITGITAAGAVGFDLDGGNAAVTFDGTVSASGSGRSVEVTNRTGNTVDFNGLITDNGSGINLNINTGATIRFDGGITASTGANTALNATGGGTIAVTDANGTPTPPNNTLTTTTGTALNVANTTVHADGLTFRSISANGAANGIVLNNTGAGGGLTVTGDGSTTQGGDNSGGTIQSTTGFGISLTNTTNPSFRNMRLLNTGDSGINGTQVNGFSFVDGTITGAGDASDENSITFDDSLTATPNLTGVITITNNVISQTEAEGVDIENWAGTISNANISNNALSDTGDVATPGSAITLIGSGTPTSAASITRAAINNNTITDFRAGVGIQVRAGNVNVGGPAGHAGIAGSPTDVIAITGNLMNGGTGGIGNQPDRFFTGGANGIGQGNFNLSNNGTAANRLRNIDCIAIELQADGPVTMTSTVSNNFINPNSAVGCAGIAVGTDDPLNMGAGTHTTLISGNNVMGTDGPGIFPIVRDSGSTMIARVLNNTVAAPIATNAARAGIRVDSGSAEGDTTMCLEISGNTTAGSTNDATATTSPGINLRKQGTDPTINTFGIEGLSPSPTGTPNVENHVNSLNTSAPGTFGVGGTALLSAQTGFTSCVAP